MNALHQGMTLFAEEANALYRGTPFVV